MATEVPQEVPSDSPDLAIDEEPSTPWLLVIRDAPSWLVSTVVHLGLVLALALLTVTRDLPDAISPLTVSTDADRDGVSAADLLDEAAPFAADLDTSDLLAPGELTDSLSTAGDSLGPTAPQLGLEGLQPAVPSGGGESELAGEGQGFELRLDGARRAALVRERGGSPESEQAVSLALAWLAEHQNYDGSWSFGHGANPRCHGQCGDPGMNPSRVAATAMALLPFLGTGQTHRQGQYRRTIDEGLKYLVRLLKAQPNGSLWDASGTMYGHGLASLVLCEAYGMTHDRALEAPAQRVVDFIVYAQDPNGGGWRYQPQMPGDTSVVGWQLMALKSAQMAYLRVPPATLRKTGYFLDHVQAERGAVYGYQRPDSQRPATSAIGLLCRMYLGWKQDHRPLEQGVKILSQLGPSIDVSRMKNNMYYNYYATQVMHHFGGKPWDEWNPVMRDYLVATQAKRGHEAGSWYLEGSDDGARPGGRLYCTALAAMTLEVYYRYMPLYRPQVLQAE